MKILSIDVGIKNLSYVIISWTQQIWKICNWGLISIGSGTKFSREILAQGIIREFDQFPYFFTGIDVVVIESQMTKIMANIQGMLNMYFTMKGIPKVVSIHAKNKLKLAPFVLDQIKVPKGKKGYSTRKKLSVQVSTKILEVIFGENCKSLLFLSKAGAKKDDLCDCLLQALVYIKWRPDPQQFGVGSQAEFDAELAEELEA